MFAKFIYQMSKFLVKSWSFFALPSRIGWRKWAHEVITAPHFRRTLLCGIAGRISGIEGTGAFPIRHFWLINLIIMAVWKAPIPLCSTNQYFLKILYIIMLLLNFCNSGLVKNGNLTYHVRISECKWLENNWICNPFKFTFQPTKANVNPGARTLRSSYAVM